MYVTLDDLYDLVKEGAEFQVVDAKTGEDLTRQVLTQIIFERESAGPHSMLPQNFLKQIIRMYDDNVQHFIPGYLEASMQLFIEQQERLRELMGSGGFPPKMGSFSEFNPFSRMEDAARRNMEFFRKSMEIWGGAAGSQDSAEDKNK
jgi:polyhydroxyalkanoate synthesis repressor PhaR